ncbi:hypothetical protein MMC18_006290 [Xylographa bjoerkii]|nr:hypothetical protein [Xylographa bjoerkii]
MQTIPRDIKQAYSSRRNFHKDITISRSTPESPSNVLTAALERGGYGSAVPGKYKYKLDHTHCPPLASNRQRSSRIRHCYRKHYSRDTANIWVHTIKAPRLKLQLILSRYLDLLRFPKHAQNVNAKVALNFEDALDEDILQVFNEETITFLQLKGYDPSDVQVWAWILTAKTSLEAALRLLVVSSQRNEFPSHKARHVPTFVFLFILRRPQITTQALRLLVVHGWQRLGKSDDSRGVLAIRDLMEEKVPQSQRYQRDLKRPIEYVRTYPKMSETTIVVMVIRLLRHARRSWPAAFASISTMITTQVNAGQGGQSLHKSVILNEMTSARLSFLYNKVLHLLSLPTPQHPYRAIPYHQRAQFNVISRMNEFEPALAINREGYRAVVRVQLAHRKTMREREWARMKAKSWPPWKEEKMGIDADVGIESGISRANESLSRLSEAGYGPQLWEASAKVLSGWDTDGSPTIQTRTILSKPTGQHRVQSRNRSLKDAELHGDIWAARIRATRTLHEGWACFLAYNDQMTPPSQTVYYAMIEKLVFDVKRRRREEKEIAAPLIYGFVGRTASELSGEGKEVSDLPTDPRDGIYVRTLPPSLDEFFEMMVSSRIQPSGRCLAFLLSHARSLSEGFKYLRSSNLSPAVIQLLLECEETAVRQNQGLLRQLPDFVFASYIRLLSRFGSADFVSAIDATKGHETPRDNRKLPLSPLMQAIRLLYACRPSYRPPWYSLLSALTRSKVMHRDNAFVDDINGKGMATWSAMLRLIDRMQEAGIELDFEGFHKLCIGFEKAFLAAERTLAGLHRPMRSQSDSTTTSDILSKGPTEAWERSRLDAEEIIKKGPYTLKAMFKRLAVLHSGEEDLEVDTAEYLIPRPELNSLIDPNILLPRLLEVPSPAELHALIRALGLSRDYNGLRALILWMAHYAPELRAVADELRNGAELMRRCLIATRAFMDGSWHSLVTATGTHDEVVGEQAADGVIEEVCMVIEEIDGWGGWPTDEEVDNYCRGVKLLMKEMA